MRVSNTPKPTAAYVDQLIARIFAADHARDAAAFIKLLDPSVAFRFGSRPTLHGRSEVAVMVGTLFASVVGIRHQLIHRWMDDTDIAYSGQVTFSLARGAEVALPYANTLRLCAAGLISDYRIHIDASSLQT